jgi:hypothetical protein
VVSMLLGTLTRVERAGGGRPATMPGPVSSRRCWVVGLLSVTTRSTTAHDASALGTVTT